jgi:O-antigen ligase
VIAVLAGAAAFISATGVTQHVVFHQASTLKYLLTIIAPLLVVWLVRSAYPLRVLIVPAIVVAPFVQANAGFGGSRISVIVPLLLAGAFVAAWTPARRTRLSSLALASALAFPLLAISLVSGTSVRSFVLTLTLMLVLAWLVSRTASEPGGMMAVLGAVALSGAIQGAIAIWESRTGHTLNLYSFAGTQQYASNYFYTYGSTKRPTGSFADPISLGNALATALPLTIVYALRVESKLRRHGAIAAAVLIAVALTLTLSRASWIGGVLGSILAVALIPHGLRRQAVRGLVGGVAVICVVGLITAGPAIVSRLSSITNPTNTQGVSAAQLGPAQGDRNRLEYWHVAVFDAFGQHPFSGVGIGNLGPFMLARVANAGKGIRAGTGIFIHAHSTYFQLLAEGGVLGLVLLLVTVRGLLRDAFASRRWDPVLGAGLAGAAIALLICWTTDWVIHNPPVAASVAVILGAIAAGGRNGREIVSRGAS